MKRIYVGLFAVLPVIACSGSGPQTAFAASGRPQKSEVAEASSAATLRFVLSPTGSAARYRVRERLMGHDFPNDAVGETKSLTGAIEFDANGKVIPASSKFTLDAATFVSDQNRRDGYVRNRVLEADEYPSIVVVPTDVRGVKLPLPTSGTLPIEMTGFLTVHGVTRPTTWKGSATFTNGGVTGSAATMFTFNDIQMEQPHVPVLLSVADTIRLEMDFNLVRQ